MKLSLAETLGPLPDLTVTEAVEYLESYGLRIPLGGVGLDTVKSFAQILQARDRQLGLSSFRKILIIQSDDLSEDELLKIKHAFHEKLGGAGPSVVLGLPESATIQTLDPIDAYAVVVQALKSLPADRARQAISEAGVKTEE